MVEKALLSPSPYASIDSFQQQVDPGDDALGEAPRDAMDAVLSCLLRAGKSDVDSFDPGDAWKKYGTSAVADLACGPGAAMTSSMRCG